MDIKPTLVRTKGKWYVCVTVPQEHRSALGGQKQLKASTGTSDRALAEKLLISKSNQLITKIKSASGISHPLIKAAQEVIDLTKEIEQEYSADQLLDPEAFHETVMDIRDRAAYVQHSQNHISDFEDAALIGRQKRDVAVAITKFEDQLILFKPDDDIQLTTVEKLWKISDVLKLWMAEVSFNRQKTRKSYESHILRFIRFNGDVEISKITKSNARNYVNFLANEGKSHSTVETAVAALRGLLNFAEEDGLIEANVFRGLNLRGKGKAPVRRGTFSLTQLRKLFELDMKARDRLCLQILASTGMRLDEAALLRYEDIKVDPDTGISYFDLTDQSKILKNEYASRRKIPIPDQLEIPTSGSGRLFSYPVDADGKAENAASKALLRQIKLVREYPEENLVVHSLRHTYKDLMRDAGIAKDMQDFLLGHAASSVGESYGQGYSLASKMSAIRKLDLSFIKATA